MVTMHVCNWLILMGMVLSETDVMLINCLGPWCPIGEPLKFLRQPNGFSEVFRWQRQERDLENLEMCWFGNALWPEGPKLIFLLPPCGVFFQIVQTGCILRIWKHAALAQPIIEVISWALMVQWPCPEAFVAGQRPDAVCRCWRCARTAWAMVV